MADKMHTFQLQMPATQAYPLVRQAAIEVRGFSLKREDPAHYMMELARGFGLTNPVDVTISVYEPAPGQTAVQMKASIFALADPMGFLPSVLGMFETHILAHAQALQTGQPPPPPPRDKRAWAITIGSLGCVVVLILGLLVCGLASRL